MAGASSNLNIAHLASLSAPRHYEDNPATRDSPWVKWSILTVSLLFFAGFLLLPLITVFVEAFKKGWDVLCRSHPRRRRASCDQAHSDSPRPFRCPSIWYLV